MSIKIKTINFSIIQNQEFHLSDSILEQTNFVKYLGSLVDKQLDFLFNIDEVVKKLSKTSSVLSRLCNYI